MAVVLAVSGGFRLTVGGLRLSARSPLLVIVLALVNLSAWWMQARRARAVTSDLDAIWTALRRSSAAIILAIAILAGVVAAAFATRSAAGADASGYVSEASLFTRGHLFHQDDLAAIVQGQDPFLSTPLGWRPAPVAGAQSPTYAPGLPMLMALPHALAGITGAALVVIASAVAAVIAAGLIASHLGGGAAGIIAAALVAFTPVFLYQSIQPMSDVPVTAAWLWSFWWLRRDGRGASIAAGIACAIAVLIRPNLAPLAAVLLVAAHRRLAFAVPVAIAGLLLAWLQWQWYGSPLRSGYGAADELFALGNVMPNVARYARWWWSASPALLLGVVGAIELRSNSLARAMTAFAALVIAAYLVYAVFDDWSYLRFLLPALAIAAIFTAVTVARWIERSPTAWRAPLLFVAIVGLSAHGIWFARHAGTFKLAGQLRRVGTVAVYLDANIPSSAVLLSGEQSGSMRYYTRRAILRWEAAAPQSLEAVLPRLDDAGRPVFVVLDAWEEPLFRAKLGAALPLDWPPMVAAGTTHRTQVWRLSDRDRYRRGEAVDTIRLP